MLVGLVTAPGGVDGDWTAKQRAVACLEFWVDGVLDDFGGWSWRRLGFVPVLDGAGYADWREKFVFAAGCLAA